MQLEKIRSDLNERGFAVLTEATTDDAFMSIASEFGTVVDDTLVRLVSGRRTYLASPGAIPLHTDHPQADLIAWYCRAQDAEDGAFLLADGLAVLDHLRGDEEDALSSVLLPAMVRLGDQPQLTPVVRRGRTRRHLFFAPWLQPLAGSDRAVDVLKAFQCALESRSAGQHRIRLEPGQILIADNHRMLHGRAALNPESRRSMRRFWIRSAAELCRPWPFAAPHS